MQGAWAIWDCPNAPGAEVWEHSLSRSPALPSRLARACSALAVLVALEGGNQSSCGGVGCEPSSVGCSVVPGHRVLAQWQ